MSYGRMNTPIQILRTVHTKDKDGFAIKKEVPVACVRAYKEDKNTSEKWSNSALFSDITTLFQIRYIPNLTITTDLVIECYDGRYQIKSVENVRGRNMYIQILASKESVSNGKG